MKPVTPSVLEDLNNRTENFNGIVVNSLDVISADIIKLTLSAQDRAKDFDWVGFEFEFSGIEDAILVENEKLKFIDTISLFFDSGSFCFSTDSYNDKNGIKNALCYIISKTLKFDYCEAHL